MRPVLVWGRHGLLAEALRRKFQHTESIHFWGRGDLPATLAHRSEKILRLNPSAIVNTSGFTQLQRAEASPCLSHELHVQIPSFLAAMSCDLRIPFLTVSSDYVFSSDGKKSWNEFDPPGPVNTYGRTKLEGERAVMAAYPQAKIIRTAGLFGSSPAGSKVSFPERIIQQVQEGRVPQVRSDLITSICHVDDLAMDLWQVLWGSSYGIFHVAHAGSASWLSIAAYALQAAGLSPQIRATKIPDFPRPSCSALTSQRPETRSGYAARKSWQESLHAFMRDFRNHE